MARQRPEYFGGRPACSAAWPLGLELLRRAETIVGVAAVEQPLGVLGIEGEALRLAVGPAVAAGVHALVPRQAEPPQVVLDRRFRGRRRSLAVGVLDAQDERAAVVAGQQPVEQRGARVADV